MPSVSLQKALPVAQAIWDNFAGRSAMPVDLAIALDISPTSSAWRQLTGASIAYGLTAGGYNSKEIQLTALGRRAVAPTEDGDDILALAEAAKKPTVPAEFFGRYEQKKLPADNIGANVLASMGISKERSAASFEVLKQNGMFAGLIIETKTGPFVVAQPRLGGGRFTVAGPAEAPARGVETLENGETYLDAPQEVSRTRTPLTSNSKVFISHGSDHRVLEQLEKAIRIAKLDPVASVKREATAKPVPDKVFDDMRSCFAGIIHVGHEGILTDPDGNEVVRINENVLIEIGAAIALYRKNVILLVEKSVKLPSNLQGLYRCEYEGKELSADALFKVLEAVSQFTSIP